MKGLLNPTKPEVKHFNLGCSEPNEGLERIIFDYDDLLKEFADAEAGKAIDRYKFKLNTLRSR